MKFDKSVKKVIRDFVWDMAKNGMYGHFELTVAKGIMDRLNKEHFEDMRELPPHGRLGRWAYETGSGPCTSSITIQEEP